MKAATVKELKYELSQQSNKDLIDICLRLSKFKKENKELLTYLLYEAQDESAYIRSVKSELDTQFNQINNSSIYYIKKSLRKILTTTKKYIRYSQKKETEVEILMYFCHKLKITMPGFRRSTVIKNMYIRQFDLIVKTVSSLHEDLQFDYNAELESLQL
jgi:arginine deiminase